MLYSQFNQSIIKTMNRNRKSVGDLKRQGSGDPVLIQSLIAALNDKTAARLKASKQLQLISQANPSLLYPHFEVFAKLLDNKSSVLLWNGIIILSYLVSVDKADKFDAILDKYYGHLWDGKLVTAANIFASSGRIACSRPDLASRITSELLKVDNIPLPTSECREVARNHVLTSFAEYLDMLRDNQQVKDFIIRCTSSHRPAVKRRAEALIKCINKKPFSG
jgi:hypothetical protein